MFWHFCVCSEQRMPLPMAGGSKVIRVVNHTNDSKDATQGLVLCNSSRGDLRGCVVALVYAYGVSSCALRSSFAEIKFRLIELLHYSSFSNIQPR